jgi:hypothetical protein
LSASVEGVVDVTIVVANQIGREFWQSIVAAFCPAIFDHDVLAFGITGFLAALTPCAQPLGKELGRIAAEEADLLSRLRANAAHL